MQALDNQAGPLPRSPPDQRGFVSTQGLGKDKMMMKNKLEVTFSENITECLKQMIPYARTMYSECDYDIRTPEDIVRYALNIVMEEITREYGEYVIEDFHGSVNKIYFPNRENPLYEIDK